MPALRAVSEDVLQMEETADAGRRGRLMRQASDAAPLAWRLMRSKSSAANPQCASSIPRRTPTTDRPSGRCRAGENRPGKIDLINGSIYRSILIQFCVNKVSAAKPQPGSVLRSDPVPSRTCTSGDSPDSGRLKGQETTFRGAVTDSRTGRAKRRFHRSRAR